MLAGGGTLRAGDFAIPMNLGQSVLIPAACPQISLTPNAGSTCTVLDGFLP
jgi:hypothetical protein